MCAADKKGKIKTELFFQMLELHQISLGPKDRQYLQKLHSNGDQIAYKEALGLLIIDSESAQVDEQKWTVQRPQEQKK